MAIEKDVVVKVILNALFVRGRVTLKRISTLYIVFLTRLPISPNFKQLNQSLFMKNIKNMMLKTSNLAQSSTNPVCQQFAFYNLRQVKVYG